MNTTSYIIWMCLVLLLLGSKGLISAQVVPYGNATCGLCPPGSYLAGGHCGPLSCILHYCRKYTQCNDPDSYEIQACAGRTDTVCGCRNERFWRDERCYKHSQCPPDYGVTHMILSSWFNHVLCSTYKAVEHVEKAVEKVYPLSCWMLGSLATLQGRQPCIKGTMDTECGLGTRSDQWSTTAKFEPQDQADDTSFFLQSPMEPFFLLILLLEEIFTIAWLTWNAARSIWNIIRSRYARLPALPVVPACWKPLSNEIPRERFLLLTVLCDHFVVTLEKVLDVQGFYLAEDEARIIMHVLPGSAQRVLDAINTEYRTDLATSLVFRYQNGPSRPQMTITSGEHIAMSISDLESRESFGTITGVFRDSTTGDLYALTNAHVIWHDGDGQFYERFRSVPEAGLSERQKYYHQYGGAFPKLLEDVAYYSAIYGNEWPRCLTTIQQAWQVGPDGVWPPCPQTVRQRWRKLVDDVSRGRHPGTQQADPGTQPADPGLHQPDPGTRLAELQRVSRYYARYGSAEVLYECRTIALQLPGSGGSGRVVLAHGMVRGLRGTFHYGRTKCYMDVALIPLGHLLLPGDDIPPLPTGPDLRDPRDLTQPAAPSPPRHTIQQAEYKGVAPGKRHSIATSLHDYAPGTRVQKHGAKSGHTEGEILTNKYTMRERNQELVPGVVLVKSTEEYTGTGPRPCFTEGGDSGSLVTGVGNDHTAYGIHRSLIDPYEDTDTPASVFCRMDGTLQQINQEFNLSLDFVPSLS